VIGRLLFAAVATIGTATGGSLFAAAPDANDDEIEELAEAAFEQWLISHDAALVGGTLACAVDSVSSQSVYCYSHTGTGIVAATATIPAAGEDWQFTLQAGSMPSDRNVAIPTSWPEPTITTAPVPSPTAPRPSSPPKTDPPSAQTTTGTATTFGDGMFLVNTEIVPGRYRAEGSDFCYGERLSAPDEDFESILANFITEGPAVVDIRPTDVAFNSHGCGKWTRYVPPATPATTFGPGMYVVGADIAAGTYSADGGADCYWRRLAGFSANFDELTEIDNMTSPGTVVIEPTDVGFESSQCGTWTLTSPGG
jgi:hypothetical protein